MAYRVEITTSAASEIRKLERDVQLRAGRKIKPLADNPRPPGVQKLQGAEILYRVRFGDYRIVYAIDDAAGVVTIHSVADRKDVYRR